MKNDSSSMILWVIALPLLLFTGFRSVHLIQSTLPSDAHIIAFAALAGLDGGLLAWLYFATNGARGNQRTVSILMIAMDMTGIGAATIGDTLAISDPGGASGFVGPVAMWIVPLIITFNVLGTVVAHLVDPAQQIKDKERELKDALDMGLAQHLADNASAIAAQAVPAAAQHKVNEMVDSFLLSSQVRHGGKQPVSLESIAARLSGNGGKETEFTSSDTHPMPILKKE